MTTRSALASSSIAALLAAVALGVSAQTKAPAADATAAKDRAAAETAFKRADVNNDGKLSREEAAKLPAIAAKFDDLDKDKDGSLSLEELAAGFAAGN